ncbi:MAG: hypothetical protein NZ455_04185 [Bacteroidia bacterium]|nr:hypothetical protein [Bacteroidia bacterium]
MKFIFGRVPRCARVGLLRTTLTLRCYALPNGMLRIPHASCILMLYLVFIHIFALPCFIFIINHLQY